MKLAPKVSKAARLCWVAWQPRVDSTGSTTYHADGRRTMRVPVFAVVIGVARTRWGAKRMARRSTGGV